MLRSLTRELSITQPPKLDLYSLQMHNDTYVAYTFFSVLVSKHSWCLKMMPYSIQYISERTAIPETCCSAWAETMLCSMGIPCTPT